MIAELEEVELHWQVVAVHPKVAMKAQKLQDLAQLAMLERGGGDGGGRWSTQDEQRELQRVCTIKQLKRKLKI